MRERESDRELGYGERFFSGVAVVGLLLPAAHSSSFLLPPPRSRTSGIPKGRPSVSPANRDMLSSHSPSSIDTPYLIVCLFEEQLHRHVVLLVWR